MSNEQPPVRDVIPFKASKRPSTFRRLKLDFTGTALEQALAEKEIAEREEANSNPNFNSGDRHDAQDYIPLSTTPHHSTDSREPRFNPTSSGDFTDSGIRQASATPIHHSPPPPVNPLFSVSGHNNVAPIKDFNRRANSIERDAMPSGLFPGSTKKVYDAIYLRTRGAVTPCKKVQASRRDLLGWTGIKNLKTIDNHLRYLMAKNLIIRHWDLGSNEGSSYEVCLPEELTQTQQPLSTTGGDSPLPTTPQKLGIPTTQKLGSGGEGQPYENNDTYDFPNTFLRQHTDDDTHTLAELTRTIAEAARGVVGGELTNSIEEQERWAEVGRLLAEELRHAASNAASVSSVSAFFAAHLRRKLKPNEQRTVEPEEAKVAQSDTQRTKGVGVRGARRSPIEGGSEFTVDECRRYADHLAKSGQGITNPGGYATKIQRTGEADAAIRAFLVPAPPVKHVDASRCPDCHGTGYYYPRGREHGVARCKHEHLIAGDAGERAEPAEAAESVGDRDADRES